MYKSAIAILAALCVVSTTNAAAPVRQRTKTVHQSSITTDEQYDPYMGISQHRHAMEEDHSMSMKGDDHSMSMKGDDHDGHGHGEDDHSDDKEMVDESSR
jgi:hypothetical protein